MQGDKCHIACQKTFCLLSHQEFESSSISKLQFSKASKKQENYLYRVKIGLDTWTTLKVTLGIGGILDVT